MPRKPSAANVGAVKANEREAHALALRRAGVDYPTIARKVGFANAGGAWKAVHRGLQRTLRTAGSEEVRTLEVERLDQLQMGLWPDAIRGDVRAIDCVLRVMERRARLLGLDSPVRAEIAGPDGGPIEVASIALSQDEQDQYILRIVERACEREAAATTSLMTTQSTNGQHELTS
jgi:hypothetical protein